jgi:hypothetical protein
LGAPFGCFCPVQDRQHLTVPVLTAAGRKGMAQVGSPFSSFGPSDQSPAVHSVDIAFVATPRSCKLAYLVFVSVGVIALPCPTLPWLAGRQRGPQRFGAAKRNHRRWVRRSLLHLSFSHAPLKLCKTVALTACLSTCSPGC